MATFEKWFRREWDRAKRKGEAPWGSTPPADEVFHQMTMVIRLSGRGYTGSATLDWVKRDRPAAGYRPLPGMTQETSFRQDWPFEPSVGAVLRACSRYAWDMSISPAVRELEGQEALPGL